MARRAGDAGSAFPSRAAPGLPVGDREELIVQVFGRRDSRPTQKALRFFRERRIETSFVDVAMRPPAPGELRRFVERHGPAALLDTESRSYRDAGLAYMRLEDGDIVERVLADPRLLRLPLVRAGTRLSIGDDEPAWRSWLPELRGADRA